jgi:hypothetical protein
MQRRGDSIAARRSFAFRNRRRILFFHDSAMSRRAFAENFQKKITSRSTRDFF